MLVEHRNIKPASGVVQCLLRPSGSSRFGLVKINGQPFTLLRLPGRHILALHAAENEPKEG